MLLKHIHIESSFSHYSVLVCLLFMEVRDWRNVEFYRVEQKETHRLCFLQIGDLNESKSFLLDVSWPEAYPETAPHMSLDAFFNNRM